MCLRAARGVVTIPPAPQNTGSVAIVDGKIHDGEVVGRYVGEGEARGRSTVVLPVVSTVSSMVLTVDKSSVPQMLWSWDLEVGEGGGHFWRQSR
jgi:hypothetical protein